MTDVAVAADLHVEEADGDTRPLNVEDLKPARTGAASDAKLEQVRALIALIATEASQLALTQVTEAIRDRIGSSGAGIPEEGTSNYWLRRVAFAAEAMNLAVDTLNLSGADIDLNTDQLEEIQLAIGAALGTTDDPSTTNTAIGRLQRIVELLGGELAVTVTNPTADPETGLAKDATLLNVDAAIAEGNAKLGELNGRLPDESGVWDYAGGADGTVELTGGKRVLGAAAVATEGGATVSINGGDEIPVPVNIGWEMAPRGNLDDATFEFVGTASFMVEFVT
jgi:hypothetical protein